MSGKNATETITPHEAGISRAADILTRGGLVAVPTETVYGLAVRADDDAAVARIYAAKGRPDFNPLIVHVANLTEARKLAEFADEAERMAQAHWPGPLTLVLPRKQGAQLADAVTAGLPSVAIRVPAHPIMQAILQSVGMPLAAPSANRSGFISPTTAAHVLTSLDGQIDAVLDGGECEAGVESTILALRDGAYWEQLRPGPIAPPQKLRRATLAGNAIEAPGQLARHYAPGKPVRLNVRTARDDEFLIGFGEVSGHCSLSQSGSLAEAAAQLYACLHLAAASDLPRIAIAPIPTIGIGIAINDRLKRAAA